MYVVVGYNFIHTLPSLRLLESIALKIKDQDVIDSTFVEVGDRVYNQNHGNMVEVALRSRQHIRGHPIFRLLPDQNNFPAATYRNMEDTVVLIQYYEPNDLDSNQGFLFLQRGMVDLSNLRALNGMTEEEAAAVAEAEEAVATAKAAAMEEEGEEGEGEAAAVVAEAEAALAEAAAAVADKDYFIPEIIHDLGIPTLETTNISAYPIEKRETILKMGIVRNPDEFIAETRIAEELAFIMDPLMYRITTNHDFIDRLPLSVRAGIRRL